MSQSITELLSAVPHIPFLPVHAIGSSKELLTTVDKVEEIYATFSARDATPPLGTSSDGIVEGNLNDRDFYIMILSTPEDCRIVVVYQSTADKANWVVHSNHLLGSPSPLDKPSTNAFVKETVDAILKSPLLDRALTEVAPD